MDTTRVSRPIPLGLTMLVAFFSALAALAVSNDHDAHAHGTPDEVQAPMTVRHSPAALTQSQAALRTEMRRLWEDHIIWTRLAVISLTTDSPDTDATGREAATEPGRHRQRGQALLRQGGGQRADAPAAEPHPDRRRRHVNPRYWKLAAMKAALRTHLELATDEVVARLQKNWNADVAAYDKIHRRALHMSDLLSDGLIKQFPKRFR